MVEEISRTDSSFEVGKDIGNVFHEFLLRFKVVEAEKSQVLVDGKEDLAMDFIQKIISNELNVSHQRNINTLSNIDSLEQLVISLLFIEIVVDCVFVEHAILNKHQRLNVLQIYVLLQCSRKEEEVLQDTRSLSVIFLHGVIWLFNVVRELFVAGFGEL